MYPAIYNAVIPIFVLIILGFLTGKISKVNENFIKAMSNLILYILVPCLVFTSVLQISLSSVIWYIVFSAVFVILIIGIFAYIISKLIRLDNSSRKGFLLTTMFMNAGSMASSICLLFYGPEGFILSISFYLTTQILLYTLGVFIASSNGRKFDLNSLKIIITLPLIYALLLGGMLSYFNISLPSFVLRPIDLLSFAAVPLLLLNLGMQLSSIKLDVSKLRTPTLSTVMRIGFGFILGLTFTHLMGLKGVHQGVIIIASTMPTKISTFPIAIRFNTDPERVSISIMLSTIFSLMTIPLILLFLSL